MKPGIFHVTFSTPLTSDTGEGLAVIKDGTINGGDMGYFYIGSFIRIDGSVSSSLLVKQWKPNFPSVFGGITEFQLALTGDVAADYNAFSVRGNIVGRPETTIKIDGHRIADVA